MTLSNFTQRDEQWQEPEIRLRDSAQWRRLQVHALADHEGMDVLARDPARVAAVGLELDRLLLDRAREPVPIDEPDLVLRRLGRIPEVDPGDAIGGDPELVQVRLDVERRLEQAPGERVAPPPDDHVAATAHRSSCGSGPGWSAQPPPAAGAAPRPVLSSSITASSAARGGRTCSSGSRASAVSASASSSSNGRVLGLTNSSPVTSFCSRRPSASAAS